MAGGLLTLTVLGLLYAGGQDTWNLRNYTTATIYNPIYTNNSYIVQYAPHYVNSSTTVYLNGNAILPAWPAAERLLHLHDARHLHPADPLLLAELHRLRDGHVQHQRHHRHQHHQRHDGLHHRPGHAVRAADQRQRRARAGRHVAVPASAERLHLPVRRHAVQPDHPHQHGQRADERLHGLHVRPLRLLLEHPLHHLRPGPHRPLRHVRDLLQPRGRLHHQRGVQLRAGGRRRAAPCPWCPSPWPRTTAASCSSRRRRTTCATRAPWAAWPSPTPARTCRSATCRWARRASPSLRLPLRDQPVVHPGVLAGRVVGGHRPQRPPQGRPVLQCRNTQGYGQFWNYTWTAAQPSTSLARPAGTVTIEFYINPVQQRHRR